MTDTPRPSKDWRVICATAGCGHPRGGHYFPSAGGTECKDENCDCVMFTEPASPQPGNQDEGVDLMARLRASIEQARASAAASRPGADGEADGLPPLRPGCGTTPLLAEMRRRHPILAEEPEPSPSAGLPPGQEDDPCPE